MKDFVLVKFAKGSSDAVYKGWMLEIIDLYKTEWPLFSQFYKKALNFIHSFSLLSYLWQVADVAARVFSV